MRIRQTCISFRCAPACTIWNKDSTMALNLEINVSERAHAQLSKPHRTRTHLKVPSGGNN